MIFLAATLTFHPTSTLDGRSAFIIAIFCLTFFLTAGFATWQGLTPSISAKDNLAFNQARKAPQLSGSTIRWAILFGAASNIGAALLALRASPFGLKEILTLQGLAESTNSLAVARYEGGGENLVVFLLLGFGYVAALVAPFITLTDSVRLKFLAILPALTSLAYASASSARLGFLVSCALTVGGFIATTIIRDGVAPRMKFKTVVGVILIGAVLAATFIGIGVLRTGRVDAEVIQATIDKQSSYTVGAVGAFSSWYKKYESGMDQSLGYGTATIAGAEYLTGQDREATRAYGEFAEIDTSGRTSNVYTVFRGLMLDFGIDGTVIFLAIAGFVFGRLYLGAVKGSITAATLLGFGYASILFSGWMATTTFTNILAVVVAAPAVLLLAKHRFLLAQMLRAEKDRRNSGFRRLLPARAFHLNRPLKRYRKCKPNRKAGSFLTR